MTEQQKKLVDNIFDSWVNGGTSDGLAIQQLTRIIEATSDNDLLIEANAALDTVKANS